MTDGIEPREKPKDDRSEVRNTSANTGKPEKANPSSRNGMTPKRGKYHAKDGESERWLNADPVKAIPNTKQGLIAVLGGWILCTTRNYNTHAKVSPHPQSPRNRLDF
jgi:hypothetical protein